jgi:multidrug efflux pump
MLSTIAIKRPVFAAVVALLLLALGIGAATRLPVREYPDVDQPVVSVSIVYPGASAEVVERDVTRVVEDNLNGVEDIELIDSTSRAGFAQISVRFALSRDLDAAAADVRDRVSAVRASLPEEVEEPVISKASADADAMLWVTLTSETRDRKALTDLAIRQLVDPLSVVPGVAQVIVGGARRYAMRVWLDRSRLAAFRLTVPDVTRALRSENVELPGGRIEAGPRELTVRTDTKLPDEDAFRNLVLRTVDGYQVTLGDVARIEIGAESDRSGIYRSSEPAVGLGVVRQSGSNALAVADAFKAELATLSERLPSDVKISISYDQSIFIEGSITEVVKTLIITSLLVIAVIYLFLGSLKATLVPAATIPTSIIAAFIVLYALDFSINTLTLLALVLAIGLVVDDAIVVLENVTRYREQGKPPLVAAIDGAREVFLPVVATTVVLVAVLLPVAAIEGTIGRLFAEFALTLAAAVVFSSFLALTLGAMLASRLAEPKTSDDDGKSSRGFLSRIFVGAVDRLEAGYIKIAQAIVGAGWIAAVASVALGATVIVLAQMLPGKLAPTEDRGVIIVPVTAPEGASLKQTTDAVEAIERIVVARSGENGPVDQTIAIVGTGRQGPPQVSQALVIVKLKPWGERSVSQMALVDELTPKILAIPTANAIAISPPSLVSDGFGKPIQFVLSGPDYETVYDWAKTVRDAAAELGTMNSLEIEFNQRAPQAVVRVDRRRAADLGVSVADIGETLRVFLGGTDVTEFFLQGETYEVVVRGEAGDRDAVADIGNLLVRGNDGKLISLEAVVDITERGTAASYRRVDRSPSVVISAVPRPGEDIAAILTSLEEIVEAQLPTGARINYLGLSREFKQSSSGILLVFGLALVIVFLVLAALFESFIYPAVVLFAVPLAIAGGMATLLIFGMSLNIFSQIALLLLIALLAKNAILVVDFANQQRAAGADIETAILEAAKTRFRPILMTSIATGFGAVPLALATGPGAEARAVIGVVIIFGTLVATAITLLIVPGLYRLAARFASVPGAVEKRYQKEKNQQSDAAEDQAAPEAS